MNKYRADLHIHTLLSPCASLEMTPQAIVEKAKASGLHIIGVTDHNSTKHSLLVKKLAEKEGIFTLTGAEVTTKEEVHCLVFFEQPEQLIQFQQYIEENITRIPNSEEYYGYQPVIEEDENILEMVPYYLPAALKVGIEKIQKRVDELNGLFIPAHVDRSVNGILSQLGFIPPSLKYDALGLSRHGSEKHVIEQYVIQNKTTFIRNSDAHNPEQIGEIYTVFNLEEINFSEIKKALNQQDNRFCELP
ncbi:PHP domain-containing protein [Mariniphaga sp.]|uniref:PHP domain-containing protein n=1 Tax=Mariniphaga sp. TaxID=1954475 RepID=UPI00356B3C3E